eukprot:scaffold8404_cov305-Pinguiococcus_pyrenoidosus.AAC.4
MARYLNHGTLVGLLLRLPPSGVFVVGAEVRVRHPRGEIEHPVPREGQLGLVVLQGGVGVVVLLQSSPARVVAVSKTSPLFLELVAEHQLELLARAVRRGLQLGRGSIRVQPVGARDAERREQRVRAHPLAE